MDQFIVHFDYAKKWLSEAKLRVKIYQILNIEAEL
jgi:hypothetical protein